MHQFRATKYDPSHRDAAGTYTRHEWTAFSDIGRNFTNGILTLDGYQRVEDSYVTSALGFLKEAGVRSLFVRGLENRTASIAVPPEGTELDAIGIAQSLRRVLRGEFWCRFEGESAFLHVGWDYYMYIGVPTACDNSKNRTHALGVYVEYKDSPYRLTSLNDEASQ